MGSRAKTLPLIFVHSTFRDKIGRRILPVGLEWDLPGVSHVAYTAGNKITTEILRGVLETDLKTAIVAAHNRWSFARSRPFRTVDDIVTISWKGSHLLVKWQEERIQQRKKTEELRNDNILELVQSRALHDGSSVWVNGEYLLDLTKESLPRLSQVLERLEGQYLCMKRCEGMIRIERYFTGYIRGASVFHHIMDNLIAMEDPEIINDNVIVGSAVLWDWIQGGYLLSRLLIEEHNEGIRFFRPLKNDDIATSDRTYELVSGYQEPEIALAKKEIDRLRYLSSLPLPFDFLMDTSATGNDLESDRARQHKKNRRKKFTL